LKAGDNVAHFELVPAVHVGAVGVELVAETYSSAMPIVSPDVEFEFVPSRVKPWGVESESVVAFGTVTTSISVVLAALVCELVGDSVVDAVPAYTQFPTAL
jgi:hypothetical protein